MSGGHFNYIQFSIDDAALKIKDIILYYETCNPATIEKMQIAADTLAKAAKMLHRVDLFISCDDGEESFNKRWDEENL